MSNSRIPNVLVLGTPGCGKSTLCQKVMGKLKESLDSNTSKKLNLTHLNIAELIKEKKLFQEWDDTMDCSVYDEELLVDELNKYDFEKGGFLVEFHSCEFFDNSQFDRVYVLLTEIEVLGKRLEERNYSETKIKQNLECEIFRTCLFDSYEVFDGEKVYELNSNNNDDLEKNVSLLVEYMCKFKE